MPSKKVLSTPLPLPASATISLLPFAAKLPQRFCCLHSRVLSFSPHYLLNSFQSEFYLQYSTKIVLFKVSDDLNNAKSNGQVNFYSYFYLICVFVTVDHALFLNICSLHDFQRVTLSRLPFLKFLCWLLIFPLAS